MRTIFVPHNTHQPACGWRQASFRDRQPLRAITLEWRSMRAYEVASVTVAMVTNPVVASDGWYDAETGESPGREWRWSRREGHLSFATPKTPITLYLQMDQPVASLPASQAVEVRGPSGVLATFTVPAGAPQVAKVLTPDQLGPGTRGCDGQGRHDIRARRHAAAEEHRHPGAGHPVAQRLRRGERDLRGP